jgi:hypothetical protein
MPDITPTLPEKVAGPKKALVGDEAVREQTFTPEAEVVSEKTTQKYAPEATQQADYPLHEVVVVTDRTTTDPTAPEAVQIPDAGRSPLSLPIHDLATGSPEDKFAEVADEEVGEITDEDRAKAYSEGQSLAALRPEAKRDEPAPSA